MNEYIPNETMLQIHTEGTQKQGLGGFYIVKQWFLNWDTCSPLRNPH